MSARGRDLKKGKLLERERELEAVDAAIASALEGDGTVLGIEGPPGAGKTALLAAAAERAKEGGMEVVRAQASELESGFDFGVALQLLQPPVEAAGTEALFEGAAALARPLFGGGASPSGDDPFPLIHGLHSLAAKLAEEHGLALIADDLQWSDEASLQLLAYVAARGEGSRILIVGALRTGEPAVAQAPLDALLGAAAREPLRPTPLSEAAVARMIGSLIDTEPEPDLTAAVAEASRGNPLFVRELALALRNGDGGPLTPDLIPQLGPQPIVRLVERRLAVLPEQARALAHAIAVLGSTSTARAAHLAGISADEAGGAFDALTSAELIEPGPPARFTHPILRRAAYEAVPAGERAAAHIRAAGLLRDDDSPSGRVAAHLVAGAGAAAQPSWGARALLAAAREARDRGASGEAARYLSAALDAQLSADERRGALLELGTIEAYRRDPAALEHLAAAAELAGDPQVAPAIALVRARALFYFAQLEECARVCREASEPLGAEHRELRLRLEAEALAADVMRGAGRARAADLAAEVAPASSAGERAALVHVAVEEVNSLVAHERVRGLAERAWAGGVLAAEIGTESPTYSLLGTTLAWAEAYDTAHEMATVAVEDGRERGSLVGMSYGLALRSGIALRRGDLAAAEADADLLVNSPLPASDPLAFMITLAFLIETLVERGRPDEARAALEGSGLTGDLPDVGTVHFLMLARGHLAHATGDPDQALAEYGEAGRRIERAGYLNPAGMAWRSRMATVLSELRADDEAPALAHEEVKRCRAFGAPRALGVALIAAGRAVGGSEGEARLREAVSVLAGSQARLEHARALVVLGSHLRRAGRDGDAREPLAEGMDRAHRCGGVAVVEQALAELHAAGARPRRPALHGADSLTPQERRVTRLAVEGRSNREIAEALFLARRTVETHLSNAYVKLEIDGREQLAEALAS